MYKRGSVRINATFRRVRLTPVGVEKQCVHILSVYLQP